MLDAFSNLERFVFVQAPGNPRNSTARPHKIGHYSHGYSFANHSGHWEI
ncbi:MAG: hypothetical protein HQM13_12580 [SAR324 cluster bacterium]|nr:hypothetical protein [SAR324 cluster bacterium]